MLPEWTSQYKALLFLWIDWIGNGVGDAGMISLCVEQKKSNDITAFHAAENVPFFHADGKNAQYIGFEQGVKDKRFSQAPARPAKVRRMLCHILHCESPILIVAYDAQRVADFLRLILRGCSFPDIHWLDLLTIYRDRRTFPYNARSAFREYDIRESSDAGALRRLLEVMDEERGDVGKYVDLFGVFGGKVCRQKIRGVRYEVQGNNIGFRGEHRSLPELIRTEREEYYAESL